MSTKERLAQKLHELGLFNLEERARKGEFSDFEGPHATPKIELVKALQEAMPFLSYQWSKQVAMLVNEVTSGKWDDTEAEAEAWAKKEGL